MQHLSLKIKPLLKKNTTNTVSTQKLTRSFSQASFIHHSTGTFNLKCFFSHFFPLHKNSLVSAFCLPRHRKIDPHDLLPLELSISSLLFQLCKVTSRIFMDFRLCCELVSLPKSQITLKNLEQFP